MTFLKWIFGQSPEPELTELECQTLKNLRSSDQYEVDDAAHQLVKLDLFNLIPYLDKIAKNLPVPSKPFFFDYRERVELKFQLLKHQAEGKCHCDFYEKWGAYFKPESELERRYLIYKGKGIVDFDKWIDEKVYECKVCGSCWGTNENIGWHLPVIEWRKM
jgi:hypothetical protein